MKLPRYLESKDQHPKTQKLISFTYLYVHVHSAHFYSVYNLLLILYLFDVYKNYF